MGSKSAVVGFFGDAVEPWLRPGLAGDQERSRRLAEQIVRKRLRPAGTLPLDLAIWPEPGMVTAAALPGLDLVAAQDLATYRPSQLTPEISRVAAGRDACAVFMHSSEDWAAFAVWEQGRLVRSLSLNPEAGVLEDEGARLPWEECFWRGAHPVSHVPDYAFPFHPLDLGNEALQAFFGFALEAVHGREHVNLEDVAIPAFVAEN